MCTVWMITVGIIFQNKCTRLGFHETFNQNIKEIFWFKEQSVMHNLKRWNVWGYFVLSFSWSDVFLSHVVNGRSFIKLIFQTVGVTLLLSFGCSLYINVTSEHMSTVLPTYTTLLSNNLDFLICQILENCNFDLPRQNIHKTFWVGNIEKETHKSPFAKLGPLFKDSWLYTHTIFLNFISHYHLFN